MHINWIINEQYENAKKKKIDQRLSQSGEL